MDDRRRSLMVRYREGRSFEQIAAHLNLIAPRGLVRLALGSVLKRDECAQCGLARGEAITAG